jgi:GT2 family glycosyltransferase
MVVVSNNIELFLKKVGRSSRIHKTEFGAFASEHSEIDGEDIIEIKTDPHNAWIRKGGKIKFIYPCRIFDVQMREGIVIEQSKVPEFLKNKLEAAQIQRGNNVEEKVVDGNVVIDSNVDVVASNLFKCNKVSGGIVMSAIGKFSIPLALLEPNTEYKIILHSKIINGNGRIGVQLLSNGIFCGGLIIANNNLETTVMTSPAFAGVGTYSLEVCRPAKISTGSIVVSYLKIIKTKTINNMYNLNCILKNVVPLHINNINEVEKKASILISTYNRPKLLKLGLQSLARQDFNKQEVEIIVLNDYLPDDTEKICKEFNDLDIKYVYTGQRNLSNIKSRTPGYAINIGAKIAKGKFIFISCAEIYHLDNTVSDMLNILKDNNKIITTCFGKEDSGRFLEKLNNKIIDETIDFDKEKLIENNLITMELPYFIGLNKQYFMDIGGYDEDFIGLVADDNDLSDRLKQFGCKYHYTNNRIIHLYHERLLVNGGDLKIKNDDVQKRVDFNRKLYKERAGTIIRNSNGWGNVNIINRHNDWKLKNIPKIIHFYWGGAKLSFLRYLTIYSFIKNNPGWSVKLHIPKILGNNNATWNSNEQKISQNQINIIDCFNLISELNVEIIKHDFVEYGFFNNVNEVHKSDFLRWKLLHLYGGIWSDMDILYTQPINYMIDNNDQNSNITTGVCTYDDGIYAIGFLMSSVDNIYYKKISEIASKKFKAKDYQSIGNKLLPLNIRKEPNVLYINVNTVYSITNCDNFFNGHLNVEDFTNAIGFHWYGGHNKTAELEKIIYSFNCENFSFINKLVKYIEAK